MLRKAQICHKRLTPVRGVAVPGVYQSFVLVCEASSSIHIQNVVLVEDIVSFMIEASDNIAVLRTTAGSESHMYHFQM